ncbi:MAG: GTP 3',8-cyclase MoaA [Saprospiraceae bacterium]|nr:GTP 3',8-cyclase MoaA [Saprospiraceae bacterium]
MLIDRFGRTHDYLRISLTDKCNLRCNYCMPENPCFLPNSRLFSGDEIAEIVKIFVSDFHIRKIRFTGGEPLLRKDFFDIVNSFSHLPLELVMTTNGILLDRFLEQFKAIGIKQFNISLDTLRPDRYALITGFDYFRKVFENIRLAMKAGFQIKVNAVIKKGINEDEVLDFIRLTEDEDFHVRFIEFMPFNGNFWLWDEVISHKSIYDQIAKVYVVEKLADEYHSTARAFQVKGFKGTFAIISPISAPFCGTCNRIRLTADGKLKNCLFSNEEFDILSSLRQGLDIRPIIRHAIQSKHAERGGLGSFTDETAEEKFGKGRSMTAIGG